jgi:o-succinylbenzoate synthase
LDINLSLRTLHFKRPARTSRGAYSERRIILLTATDKESRRIGLGECAPLPDLSSDRDAYPTLSSVAQLIRQALDAEDYTEFLRPYPALLFALESAIHDYRQTPSLYDTPFARSEVGIPFNGLIWMSSPDEMLAQIKQKLLQGFHCIKLKIGANNWDEELALIRKVRSRYSPESLELRVDANGAFTPDTAMKRLEALAALGIHSIEQPIAQYQWKEMAALCADSPLPIALDEELIGVTSLEEKRLLLDTIRPQYIVLKPTLHGGMSGTMEWVSEAHRRGIGSWMTSALESNVGLRNVALLTAVVYGSDIRFSQGLGTGALFTDNIEMDMEVRGSKMWRSPVER